MQQGLGALSKVGVAQNGTDEFEKNEKNMNTFCYILLTWTRHFNMEEWRTHEKTRWDEAIPSSLFSFFLWSRLRTKSVEHDDLNPS
jgi:hypothetical protein